MQPDDGGIRHQWWEATGKMQGEMLEKIRENVRKLKNTGRKETWETDFFF